mmetsp:Transcript_57069/g.68642  ORF Transcript_57069/g.68642 Transcript_57069/m.68642 type:complete len:366 (+) Transcript_57069:90-1187(+)
MYVPMRDVIFRIAVLILLIGSQTKCAESLAHNAIAASQYQKELRHDTSSRHTRLYAAYPTQRLGSHIDINNNFPGLERVHSNPDVFIIKDFLGDAECSDIIQRAKEKTLDRSPVAYAGWTNDVKDLLELAAKGPVSWLSLIIAWLQVKDDPDASQLSLVTHALQNFPVLLLAAVALISAYTKIRIDGLKELRTSSSTTLDDLSDSSSGHAVFVRKAAELFDGKPLKKEASHFEAPTVIRYESGQVLAPHFDANQAAEVEDANRGGQTLATLIVYLNDVDKGGLTRFGKLPATNTTSDPREKNLTVKPKKGEALLFFPADRNSRFDEMMEHEGCPADDEKWIARIWRHTSRVPQPFGLSEKNLSTL